MVTVLHFQVFLYMYEKCSNVLLAVLMCVCVCAGKLVIVVLKNSSYNSQVKVFPPSSLCVIQLVISLSVLHWHAVHFRCDIVYHMGIFE